MVNAICKELQSRKNEFESEKIETIYFGGGTPSVLSIIEWVQIFKCVQQNYILDKNAEITVEANPDDLNEEYIRFLYQLGVNRLSIGIQSFFDHHLTWMNRAHNAEQAMNCILKAKEIGITNITIDLIYGIPLMTLEEWEKNIDIALGMNIPHISCYNLTVESKTKLANDIKKGKSLDVDDEQSHIEYTLLCEKLKAAGYIHYEISNFGKLGYFSRHNTAYWQSKNYLGIGPSAHSFNGKERLWNISNNSIYIEKLEKNELPQTLETLTNKDLFNEHILIGFRTIWGCDLTYLK
jgi:oxygen-independent coproporphyrinogen-3 oxidase